MANLAPVILFTYKRLSHTTRTINALAKNYLAKESQLIIYSDASKAKKDFQEVSKVRKYLHQLQQEEPKKFKEIKIIERERNWGLAKSIIDGVTTTINQYGKVIVLEDDLVTSPYFLTFMNDGLDMYENSPLVASIHGYTYSVKELPNVYFLKGADCWGWATWKRAWDHFEPNGKVLLQQLRQQQKEKIFDFNNTYPYTKMLIKQTKNKVDSWAIRWYASCFLKDMLTLYPGISYVENIGLGGNAASHFTLDKKTFTHTKLNHTNDYQKIATQENLEARKKIEQFLLNRKTNVLKRLFLKIQCKKKLFHL